MTYAKGHASTGSRPKFPTKEIRRWWSLLAYERPNGHAKFSKKQLRKIADSDDRRHPLMKRVAAAHILMMLEDGPQGLAVLAMMFDRLEGKVPLRVDLGLDDQPKRIILIERPEQLVESSKEIVDVQANVLEVGGGNGVDPGAAVDARVPRSGA